MKISIYQFLFEHPQFTTNHMMKIIDRNFTLIGKLINKNMYWQDFEIIECPE